MEADHLSANFDEIEGLAAEILAHGKCILDKTKVYEVRIQVLYALNKMNKAVQTACSALGLLGVRIPKKPRKRHVVADLLKTKLVLAGKKIEGIGDLPKMTYPRSLDTQDLRCRTLVTSYTFTVHWKQHLRDSLEPMLEAHQSGIESGDIEFGAIALHMYSRDLFYVGEHLSRVEKK